MAKLVYIDKSVGQEVAITVSDDDSVGIDLTMRNLVEPMLLAAGYYPDTIRNYMIEWADELRENDETPTERGDEKYFIRVKNDDAPCDDPTCEGNCETKRYNVSATWDKVEEISAPAEASQEGALEVHACRDASADDVNAKQRIVDAIQSLKDEVVALGGRIHD